MKKILTFALALLVVASMAACKKQPEQPDNPDDPGKTEQPAETNFTETKEDVYARVTTDLRSAPAVDAGNIKGALRYAQKAERIGISDDAEHTWSKVVYEGQTYYVSTNCLTNEPITVAPEFEKVSDTVYTTGKVTLSVNFDGTTEVGDVTVEKDTKLSRTGKSDDLSAVTYNGKVYYIANSSLTTTAPSEKPPVTDPDDPVTPVDPSKFEEKNDIVYVTADFANLRDQPVKKSDTAVDSVPMGTELKRISGGDGWSKVSYAGAEYYIWDGCITTLDIVGKNFTVLDTPKIMYVKADSLNVRLFAYTSREDDPNREDGGNIFTTLSKGAQVTVVAVENDPNPWVRVQIEGKYYYALQKYGSKVYLSETPVSGGGDTPVTPVDPSETVKFNSITPAQMRAKGSTVNLYSKPDSSSTPALTLTKDTVLMPNAMSTDEIWYRCTYNNNTYYIHVSDLIAGK